MAGSRREEPAYLVVGHVTKPHGTRGELLVWPLTDRPGTVFAAGSELLAGDSEGRAGEGARRVVVAASRPFRKGLLVKLEGADDRSAAEALVGRYLLAAAAALEPLEEGEVYYHQLLGAAVELVDGRPVGTVREVYETAPADLLEVTTDGGRLVLIPFTRQIVKRVDVAAGRIVIDPPAGLLEL